MVYNAMKLFMEVNPQLFDECSQDYTDQQNNAEAIKANRQAKWERLSQLAEQMKSSTNNNTTTNSRPLYNPTSNDMRPDDGDPMAQERESQQRMERLRLQDDQMQRESRRPKEYERHNSGSGR